MVIYEFRCKDGHEFEGEFPTIAEYERQQKAGMVACPLCDSRDLEKLISRVNINTQGAVADKKPEKAERQSPKMVDQRYLMAAKEKLLDVGNEFPDEARRMYHDPEYTRERLGKKEGIIGSCSPDEQKALVEEGLPIEEICVVKLDS